jgi:hypothetical protein
VFTATRLDPSSAGSTSQKGSNVLKLCTCFFSKNRLLCLVQVYRSFLKVRGQIFCQLKKNLSCANGNFEEQIKFSETFINIIN